MRNNQLPKDLLNRKEEGEFLLKYLIKRYENKKDESFVLNINAEWGFGKTYFLKQLTKELNSQKYPVVYFDAWKNDYTKQPLLAFISELNTSLTPYFDDSPKAKSLLVKTIDFSKNVIVPIGIKKLFGMAVSEIEELNDIKIDDELEEGISTIISKTASLILEEHKNIQSSIELFKESMLKLLKYIEKNMTSKKLPMFICIDELDRCRPNYAIELLESIKHIFDIEGIIFIIATDSKQLSHSINAVYGNNFASEKYLKRFFNQEYSMVKPDNYFFANYLFEMNDISNHEKLFSSLNESTYKEENINVKLFALYASYFKLSLRDQEQVMTVLYSIILTWEANESIHLGYLLFLIILKQNSNLLFDTFNELSFSDKKQFLKNYKEKICVNEEITYKTMKDIDDYRKTFEEVSIVKLIEPYISTLGKDCNEINKVSNNTNSDYKINNKFISETPSSNFSNKKGVIHHINTYPDLVLRAGQFT